MQHYLLIILHNSPAITLVAGSDVPTVLLAVTDILFIIDKSVVKLTLTLVVTLSVVRNYQWTYSTISNINTIDSNSVVHYWIKVSKWFSPTE